MDLVDSYRTFHPNAKNMYSSQKFVKTHHILVHEASHSKYKEIKIVSWSLSNHNGIQAESWDEY